MLDSCAEVYSPSYPLSPTEDEKTKTASLVPLLEAVSQLAKLSKANQETQIKTDRKQQPSLLKKLSKDKPPVVKSSMHSLSESTKSSNVEVRLLCLNGTSRVRILNGLINKH